MWKFQDFSITQILREINFGEFRSSENAVFAYFRLLIFVNLVNFSLKKVQKIIENQNSEPLNMADFALLDFQKLI